MPINYLAILISESLSRHSLVQILAISYTSKSVPTLPFYMILTSKSLSRHSVVQILRIWISKTAPALPIFNNFYFQIALAPQRDAKFGDIFRSRSSATPFFGSWLCEPSKPQNYGNKNINISRNSYPPKYLHLIHLNYITSALLHLFFDKSPFKNNPIKYYTSIPLFTLEKLKIN